MSEHTWTYTTHISFSGEPIIVFRKCGSRSRRRSKRVYTAERIRYETCKWRHPGLRTHFAIVPRIPPNEVEGYRSFYALLGVRRDTYNESLWASPAELRVGHRDAGGQRELITDWDRERSKEAVLRLQWETINTNVETRQKIEQARFVIRNCKDINLQFQISKHVYWVHAFLFR